MASSIRIVLLTSLRYLVFELFSKIAQTPLFFFPKYLKIFLLFTFFLCYLQMASSNNSINAQEVVDVVKFVVVAPLPAPTTAMEDTMMEEPPVLTRRSRSSNLPRRQEKDLRTPPTRVKQFRPLCPILFRHQSRLRKARVPKPQAKARRNRKNRQPQRFLRRCSTLSVLFTTGIILRKGRLKTFC